MKYIIVGLSWLTMFLSIVVLAKAGYALEAIGASWGSSFMIIWANK